MSLKNTSSRTAFALLTLLMLIMGCSEAKIPDDLKISVVKLPEAQKTPIAIEPGQRINIKDQSDKLLATYTARTDRPVTATYSATERLLIVKQGTSTRYFTLPINWEIETLPN